VCAALLAVASPALAQTSPLVRGIQSLNPDISAIVDAGAGYQSAQPGFIAGDDPVLRTRPDGKALGFTVQEVELALSAIVDPYLKGEVYLTIPNLSGVEVEEAVATTTSLPFNLQLRAGSFRSAFGRQNGQHLHVQEFQMRPLVNAAFLGADGLRGPGAQLSWLVPLPVFLTLYLEGYSLPGPDAPSTFTSFGGDNAGLTGLAHAKLFLELTDDLSLSWGVSSALGRSSTVTAAPSGGFERVFAPSGDTALLGTDVYLKWKPANQADGYFALSFQGELLLRHAPVLVAVAPGALLDAAWDGGLYAQVVAQLSRRVTLGLRLDLLGVPSSAIVPRMSRETIALTFALSEFAKVRASAYAAHTGRYASGEQLFSGQWLGPAGPITDSFGALAQLEISIGAHGAHAF
jgi:hypothetical protein